MLGESCYKLILKIDVLDIAIERVCLILVSVLIKRRGSSSPELLSR